MEVILESHAHQVPHVGLPQIEPVTSAIILKTNPEGAKLFEIKKKFYRNYNKLVFLNIEK